MSVIATDSVLTILLTLRAVLTDSCLKLMKDCSLCWAAPLPATTSGLVTRFCTQPAVVEDRPQSTRQAYQMCFAVVTVTEHTTNHSVWRAGRSQVLWPKDEGGEAMTRMVRTFKADSPLLNLCVCQ